VRTEYFSPAKPRVFAHRGLTKGELDENSVEALRAALDCGIEYLEIDVRASSDGVIYVLHDPTLRRVGGDPRAVRDLSSVELDRLTLLRGGKPLRLEQALNLFPTAKFNIDLKVPETISGVREILQRMHNSGSDIFKRTLLASFNDATARTAIKGLPIATSPGIKTVLLAKFGYRIPAVLRWLLAGVDALQIPVKRAGIRLDSQRFIRAVHACGVEVHYWVINEASEAKRLLRLGADGIISDRSDEIAAALAE
jgi:glycerophosphoryl diester phosphodiesterase